MEGTVLIRWEKGYEEKLVVVTDLNEKEANAAWYQMRYGTRRRVQGSQERRMGMGADEDD